MKAIPEKVSNAVRRRNPHLYPNGEPVEVPQGDIVLRRVAQSSKPRLNKLETEFRDLLKRERPDDWLSEQAVTFRLANGVRYTPDFVSYCAFNGEFNAYEVKGPRMWDDAGVKLKFAAQAFPWIRFTLVWKDTKNREWRRQLILP